jgi:nicotinamide riboside kinase
MSSNKVFREGAITMKVSITGSHSTGKTTLARAFAKTLSESNEKSVGFINEIARKVIEMGFPLNQDATIHSYLNYIWLQLKEEHESNETYVISDRSLVDLLGYIRTNNDPQIPQYFVSMLEELLWLESAFFDLYCYLPIEFPLELDNVRPADVKYQQAVDTSIQSILKEYRLPYERITGSLNDRCKALIRLLT